MKVTVKKTKQSYKNLPPGTVFRFDKSGNLALRLVNGHVLFESFNRDTNAEYFNGISVDTVEVSVVGQLTGLEVETNG